MPPRNLGVSHQPPAPASAQTYTRFAKHVLVVLWFGSHTPLLNVDASSTFSTYSHFHLALCWPSIFLPLVPLALVTLPMPVTRLRGFPSQLARNLNRTGMPQMLPLLTSITRGSELFITPLKGAA